MITVFNFLTCQSRKQSLHFFKPPSPQYIIKSNFNAYNLKTSFAFPVIRVIFKEFSFQIQFWVLFLREHKNTLRCLEKSSLKLFLPSLPVTYINCAGAYKFYPIIITILNSFKSGNNNGNVHYLNGFN